MSVSPSAVRGQGDSPGEGDFDPLTRAGVSTDREIFIAPETLAHREARLARATAAARRLEVASRLAVRLTELRDPHEIAQTVVRELHSAFGYYLAVIHRLDDDGIMRILDGAGRLAERAANFLAWEQPVDTGVNGRVVRTGVLALVDDTALDPDYVGSHAREAGARRDPGSELSVPIFVNGRVWGVLNLEQEQTHGFDEYDVMLAEAVVAQTGAALYRCVLLEEMEQSFSRTLGILCDALESKDTYTADLAEEVAMLALGTATQLGIHGGQRRRLRYAALLHDVGKIGVRSELLTKPKGLTPDEYIEIQAHSGIGSTLLERIPMLAEIAPMIRAVHERWDGTGYPDGLAEEEIPIESRIVAVCDAWHAMTSDRPYRRAMSEPDACAELQRCSGSQFDPEVVRAFLSSIDA
jgi:HD-GYP domain-containing protein (c-di-GMP phosphodiesterase class II)